MRLKGFYYDVEAEIVIGRMELENMIECALNHYSHECVAAAKPGAHAFLNGWKNKMGDDLQEITDFVKRRDLDILLKILESPGAQKGLYMKVSSVFEDTRREAERLNDVGVAGNRLGPDEVLGVRCGACGLELTGHECVVNLIRHRIQEHVRQQKA